MKRWLSSLILVGLGAVSLAPLSGLAQGEITGATVRGDNVELRSDPAQDAERRSTLDFGDALYITGDAENEKGDTKTITAATLGVTDVWFVPVMVVETGDAGWVVELYIDPRSLQQLPRPAKDPVTPAYGTRESPIPLGDRVAVGGWGVVVRGVRVASYEEIMEENMFNEAPVEGLSFVLVDVSLSNRSDTEGSAFSALSFGVLGPSNVVVTSYDWDTSCGVIPDELDDFAEVFPGGTIRGNMCFQLNRQELGATTFFAEDDLGFDGERIWFAMA